MVVVFDHASLGGSALTIDPAFGLLVALPLALAACGAVLLARPDRRSGAAFGLLAVLGFAAGCGGHGGGEAQQAVTSAPVAEVQRKPEPPLAGFGPKDLAAARAATPGAVSVDVFDTQARGGPHPDGLDASAGQTVFAVGWAYAEARHARCTAVGLLADGKTLAPGRYGYDRPDVASFYKDPARTSVGFSVAVPAGRFGAGPHRVSVVCFVPGGAQRSKELRLTVR